MDFKNPHIVSVDDNEANLYLVKSICEQINLNVKSFCDPLDALIYISKNKVHLLILDYMMPDLNGIELTREIRRQKLNMPIIMVTAVGDDDEVHKKAFEAGVDDFLSKPLNSTIFEARIKNLLNSYYNKLLLEDRAKLLEKEVKKATKKLRKREFETLNVLGKIAEYKDPETASHISRVAYYSKLLAKKYGLSEEEQELIFYSSPFHDIGKVGIEDRVLLKPSRLTDEEFKIIKTHSQIGYDILKNAKSKFLKTGAIIALNHHERYNGKGYPHRLKKDNIPLYGRIVAISDVFDALTSTRSYKEPWSFEEAVALIKKEKGEHFDPKLADIFLDNLDEVRKIYNKFKDN